MRRWHFHILILLPAWLGLSLAWAADGAEPVDYGKDVKGVLKSRCFACHGALKQEAMLRLDTVAAMQKGGESGPVIKAGDTAGSLIVSRITHSDAAERMPPEGEPPLKAEQIAAIKAWIEQGAHGIPNEQPEADPREHWAFKKPAKTPLVIPPGSTSGSALDVLISEQHQKHGLTPLGPAEKHIILRRATLDLTGLPPTREELHAFLPDGSPDAYERVVDRLLASPSYGERWGRHWMDVWRYSDWYGRRSVPDVMNSYPQIWRWRDWIVRSLNEDKGYDRMVTQMLAADEVCPGEEENLAATGFVVRNWFKWNYDQWMRDQTEHTAKALLGLTLNCALCHDHKYDPISQEEYFRFRAHFEPLELRHDRVAGDVDPGNFKKYIYAQSYGPIGSGRIRIFDEKLDAKTAMYRGGDQRNLFKDKPPVPPGILSILGTSGYDVKPVELPAEAYYPGLRPFVQREEVAKAQAAVGAATVELEAARKAMPSTLPMLAEAVTKAEAALAEVKAKSSGVAAIAALEGKQSLVLNAVQGRRALSHPVSEFKDVDDKSVVTFLVQILQDGHTNFQLALDVSKGATAGWVGFENGKIVSYKPGGFEQIELAKYDLTQSQNRFRVTLELMPATEQIKLTVSQVGSESLLVDHVPVTLKGWNGPRNAQQGIFLDARPGTAAMYDEFVFRKGDGVQLRMDFEPPNCVEGKDIAGTAGWVANGSCAAPATSLVGVPASESPEVKAKELELAAAKQAKAAAELPLTLAEKKLAAAQAEVVSVEARIKADRVRHGMETGNGDELAVVAAKAERQAKLLLALSNQTAAELAVAQASAKPMTDMKRATEVQAAQTKLTAAATAVGTADAEAQKADGTYTPLSAVFPKQSTGRRTALANWITSRDNPLTARVAVNHIWQRHFGRGIVETPANFGRNGKLPTNQPLIDSLAVELMDGGWNMKRLHRRMVTSDAYRRASSASGYAENAAKDPENIHVWRFTPARMEAEEVRDSVFYLAGELDTKIGGKEIEQTEALASHRRSIYLSHHGEARMEFLDLFDVAVPTDCYQRTSSIRPQQALALSNSELTLSQSRLMAARLWKEVGEAADTEREPKFIAAAFEQVLSRPPTELETAASTRFLATQRELAKASSDAGNKSRESLVHALLNHNDFVTVR